MTSGIRPINRPFNGGSVREGTRAVGGPFLVAKAAGIGTIPRMSPSSIDRLRRVGKIEGVSFLLLVFVAMPLKYLAGQPVAVKIVGWVHGVLFIWFCWVLVRARIDGGLSRALTALAFLASLLPFGPFLIDHRLRSASDDGDGPAGR